MRIARATVRNALRAQARVETPAPSDSFVDALERRLRSLDLSAASVSSTTRQLRRSVSRGMVIGLAAAVAGGVSAAAVAIVAGHSNDPPPIVTDTPVVTDTPIVTDRTSIDVPATTVSGPTSTPEPQSATTTTAPIGIDQTTPASTTAVPAAPTESIVAAPPAPTTQPPVQPPVQPPTEAPVTVAESIAPRAPETTAPMEATPTSSTEVHTPATLGLDCTVDSSSVRCDWTPGPAGTDHYVVLRSSPAEARGRVLNPDPGTTTLIDVGVVPANTYTYLVHALDANGVSLAHSTPVGVACCG